MSYTKSFFLILTLLLGFYLFQENVLTKSALVSVKEGNASYSARVVYVYDGDTIKVNANGIEQKIRIIGIDTPELATDKEKAECFALEARLELDVLLNQTVRLESDALSGSKDIYGRTLAHVFYDGNNVAYGLLNKGLARVFNYGNGHSYSSDYLHAQKVSKENMQGLFATEKCNEK